MVPSMSKFTPRPFGKYFLVEKLAVGGMAEIYKAKTFGVDGFEKQLVIKKILPHCAADRDFITMLVDEAKLSVLLSHTNIVQVYDLGKVSDDYFISMEFIDGCNLRQIINRAEDLKQPVPLELAVYITSEICKGLDYAHNKKDTHNQPLAIVHRDVSPQNILISYEGEVKIVDFGIAKAAMNISQTMSGILKGKVSYMSPEQALGKPLDGRTDLFSAGTLLYEMLTGKKLFSGETQFEVLKKIHTTPITEALLEEIPTSLRSLLAKALAYHPEDRYKSAGDFQIELTKYLYSVSREFSPRQVSAFMKTLFAEELHARKERSLKEAELLDAKTKTALIKAEADEEQLVHHDPAEITGPVDLPLDTTETGTPLSHSKNAASLTPKAHTNDTIDATVAIPYAAIPPLTPTRDIETTNTDTSKVTPQPPPSNKKRLFILLAILGLLVVIGTLFTLRSNHPPATQTTGSITLDSTPRGARVSLDGKKTTLTTPTTVKSLTLRVPHRVTLEKDGFSAWEKSVTLLNDTPLELKATLDSQKTTDVKVESMPSGARVVIDGQATSLQTPAALTQLAIGKTYTLRLEKEGFEPTETVLSISTGQETWQVDLKPTQQARASLAFTTVPDGVLIYVNGEPRGATPITLELDPGILEIRMEKEGYDPYTLTLSVASGETNKIGPITLAPLSPTNAAPSTTVPTPAPLPRSDDTKKPVPETPPAQTGTLTVNSTPSGASVSINDVPAGPTPLLVKGIPFNQSYKIRIIHSEYKAWEKTITLTPEMNTLNATLEKN